MKVLSYESEDVQQPRRKVAPNLTISKCISDSIYSIPILTLESGVVALINVTSFSFASLGF